MALTLDLADRDGVEEGVVGAVFDTGGTGSFTSLLVGCLFIGRLEDLPRLKLSGVYTLSTVPDGVVTVWPVTGPTGFLAADWLETTAGLDDVHSAGGTFSVRLAALPTPAADGNIGLMHSTRFLRWGLAGGGVLRRGR